MDNQAEVVDLLPHLKTLSDLYQAPECKPLLLFLSSQRDGALETIATGNLHTEEDRIKVAKAQAVYVLTNALITLPRYVKALKEQIEKKEQLKKDMEAQNFDPLGEK